MNTNNPAVLASLRGALIVSCQAEDDDPFNCPEHLALFARAAEMGGARGLRACGTENICALRAASSLPIVGLAKSRYPDGSVLITPDIEDVEAILEAGADIVATDATDRRRPNGMRSSEFVAAVNGQWAVPLLADGSTQEEGEAALQAGADALATTLSGYTPATAHRALKQPDWDLLSDLVQIGDAPVIMEGHVSTPAQARRALDLGAFAVVVGTAITRPRVVPRTFVQALADEGECTN